MLLLTMKRQWIEYRDEWSREPMTYWVHREADGKPWYEAEVFDPPRPVPVPGRGWPVYFAEIDGFTFRFASLAEMEVCIETLSRKVLPTTRRLTEERATCYGPNHHWLSRMPKGTKSWSYRQKAVTYLRMAKRQFEQEVGRSI
ncbi:MAG: hypothetical protein WBC44_14035 [Planctomycetaceae bacterium]